MTMRNVVAVLLLLRISEAFLTLSPMFSSSRRVAVTRFADDCLKSRNNDDNDEPRDDSGLQELRRLLESSWNIESMGSVPTNPESAADAAASSLLSAMSRSASGSPSSVFLIDILLPSYDITQGTNMYDEVLAAEFCIALAKFFRGKSMILMRDGKALRTVNRMLDLREKEKAESVVASVNLDDDDDDDEDEEEEADDENDEREDEYKSEIAYFDDFVGMHDEESSISDKPVSDIDAFRQKLMSSWESTETSDSIDDQDLVSPAGLSKAEVPKERVPTPSSQGAVQAPLKRHRLASMFGDATISSGPDMTDDAIRALKANGKPTDDEETIIVLSAVSPEEMVCVRGLVSSYGKHKNIVLVNCKINPLPRELIQAETVYSILPLIARPTVSERNIFGKDPNPETQSPKVVVLRRFPRDWEVFVDVGRGFELAASAPSSQVDKKGPSMEWIAGCVKRHLQSRFG